jgi:sporulation protein YqfC
MSKKIKLNRQKAKEKVKLLGLAFQIPNDPFSKLAQINLKGDKEIIVDGCYGILEYSDSLISINIGKSTLKIIGFNLLVADYFDSNITVMGTIKSLEFC